MLQVDLPGPAVYRPGQPGLDHAPLRHAPLPAAGAGHRQHHLRRRAVRGGGGEGGGRGGDCGGWRWRAAGVQVPPSVPPPGVPRHAAVPRYVFVAAQLLHGAGASPLITLGITLLDQAAAPASSPLYIGVLQAFFIIGPAAGYILGRCGLRDLS